MSIPSDCAPVRCKPAPTSFGCDILTNAHAIHVNLEALLEDLTSLMKSDKLTTAEASESLPLGKYLTIKDFQRVPISGSAGGLHWEPSH